MTTRHAPDADLRTVHIRCGHDIAEGLKIAGFQGDFLAFTDPYCTGPVRHGPLFLSQRARFLAGVTGAGTPAMLARLEKEQGALEKAPARYQRLVLWFEHDSYDQLILARVLGMFSHSWPEVPVELISIDSHLEVEPFHGLGQLSPAQLAGLWSQRTPVSQSMCALAERYWQALGSADPSELAALTRRPSGELPFMARAVRRHLQELPWTSDGLSLTQRLCLESLAGGPQSAGKTFGDVQRNREPLPWLGDMLFWPLLDGLCASGLLDKTPADDAASAAQHVYSLTAKGSAVLAGRQDYMALDPAQRWVGGVRIRGVSGWRWDEARGAPRLV